MKTLSNFSINGKNVLLRVDLNVPTIKGLVSDESKILAIKSTVDELRSKKNKIFLLTHFGRPKGHNNKYSVKFLKEFIIKILTLEKIFFSYECFGEEVIKQKKLMSPGDVCLLENIRFYDEEKKNDINFAKLLAKEYDIYINDAFSASHREHASIVSITKYLPSLAGNNFIDEIENLNKFLKNPKRPSTVIIGGSKVSTKLKLLDNLIEIFDTILIGGSMANTFLLSQGYNLGKSLLEEDMINEVKNILEKSKNCNKNIVLPTDLVCTENIDDNENIKIVEIKNILSNQIALDIGDKTIKSFKTFMTKSNTILWNGPLGAFENSPFDHATNEIAEFIKNEAQNLKIDTFAGGGDTLAALKKTNSIKYFTYVSNSGGALLQWLEGNDSPGFSALRNNYLTESSI